MLLVHWQLFLDPLGDKFSDIASTGTCSSVHGSVQMHTMPLILVCVSFPLLKSASEPQGIEGFGQRSQHFPSAQRE